MTRCIDGEHMCMSIGKEDKRLWISKCFITDIYSHVSQEILIKVVCIAGILGTIFR